jgi:ABC-type antimicrobial peptide transport system permease subunit
LSRRTNEIGVRMALGADRKDVSRMVLRESMLLVALGAVLGGIGALAASSLVERTLYGVPPRDALTMVTAIVVMAMVGLVAAYLPARRASRVDPMIALRYE